MSEQTVTSPWSMDGWPKSENGIPIIDLDELDRVHARRTGKANIARNWAHFGDVLDPAWLRANEHRLTDDAALSLWVDLVCFSGGDDLGHLADVLDRRVPSPWDDADPFGTAEAS